MSKVRLADHAIMEKVGNEMVILDLQNGQYFGLDETGRRMFELLTKHDTVEQVVLSLCAEYDATEQVLQQDVNDLLTQLQQYNLVQTVAA